MSDDWQVVTLGTVLPFRYGKGLPERNRTNDGKFRVVSSAGFTGRHSTAITSGPSVVIGRKGSIGTVHFCQDPVFPIDTTFYVEASEVIDIRFAYYLLKTLSLSQMNNDSAVPGLNRSQAEALEVSLPPLAEQRGIAATLGALDDKIESNRRTLESIDRLIQLEFTRTYQTRLVDSGWRITRLSDHVTTQYGLTASADPLADGPKFLRVTDINKRNWLNWSDVPSVSTDNRTFAKYRLHLGDLLVARMADPGKSAIYDDENTPAVFASYLVRLMPKDYQEGLFLYGFLKSSHYLEYAVGATSGSVQKNMNAQVIVNCEVSWPSKAIIERFATSVAPLRLKINQLVRENGTLITLRDALLPELLSGRIRVPEAKEAVEAVV